MRLTDGALLDYDEFVNFQQRAFADLNGIVRANTIQTIPYYRWKYHTPWGAAKLAIARINGEMVAGIAAIPWPLSDGVNVRSAVNILLAKDAVGKSHERIPVSGAGHPRCTESISRSGRTRNSKLF